MLNSNKVPVKVLNKEERDTLRRTRAFRQRNAVWAAGRFNAPQRVGKMSEIVAKSGAKTYDDFKLFYLNNIRSWEQVQEQAAEWYDHVITKGLPITPEEALAEHIIHIFDQTWEGWEREEISASTIAYLIGQPISRPAYLWDDLYAIDLVVGTDSDDFIEGYQIKPASFFQSRSEGVRWARVANAKKHKKAEALGKRVFFVDDNELKGGFLRLIHWTELDL